MKQLHNQDLSKNTTVQLGDMAKVMLIPKSTYESTVKTKHMTI